MKIPKCLNCGTTEKDYRSKRCFPCQTAYFRSKEWATTPEEIKRRKKISINNGKSNLGGKILTEEVRRKIGLAHKGNHYRLGKRCDEVTRLKISQAHIGKKLSEETRKKISKKHEGEKNYNWKGSRVGYRALHYWVEKYSGKPDICEHCRQNGLKSRQIHWANKSQEYKRDLSDWIRLCAKCHKAYDQNQLALV